MSSRPHRIFVGKDIHKFSSAHMTVFPDGSKERLHGHNFQVSVAFDLLSLELEDLLDFAVIKRELTALCQRLDQRLLLAERCPRMSLLRRDTEVEFTLCGKHYVVPADEVVFLPLSNVVVETLAAHIARELATQLGPALKRNVVAGLEVTLTESPGQGGSFYWSHDT